MVIGKLKNTVGQGICLYLLILICSVYVFTIKQSRITTVIIKEENVNHICAAEKLARTHVTDASSIVNATRSGHIPKSTNITQKLSVVFTSVREGTVSTQASPIPSQVHQSSKTSVIVERGSITSSKNVTGLSTVRQNVTKQSNKTIHGWHNLQANVSTTTPYQRSISQPKLSHVFFQTWVPYIGTNCLLHTANEMLIRNAYSIKKTDSRKYLKQLQKDTSCKGFYSKALQTKQVIPRFFGSCYGTAATTDVSLVLHMDHSTDYWRKVKLISDKWGGFISLALYIKDEPPGDLSYLDIVKDSLQRFDILGERLCVHILRTHHSSSQYSINTLRNVAIRYAQTNIIFMIDADFMPHHGLLQKIQTHMNRSGGENLTAFIIPAFGVKSGDPVFPQNKTELEKLWKKKMIVPIHDTKTFKQGHLTTDYTKWLKEESPYKVQYKSSYEPYYVVDRRKSPYYPEEFAFGTMDKSSHAFLLSKLGFTFEVLPDVFITHTKHDRQHHSVKQTTKVIKCGHYTERELGIALQSSSNSQVNKTNQTLKSESPKIIKKSI